MENYLIEKVESNGIKCKVVKAKSGGLELDGDVLKLDGLGIKLEQKLFNEGNQVVLTLRKA